METGSDSARPEWKWTQVPEFRHPAHPEWDVIQWDLEDELIKGPRAVATPVYEDDDKWYYLKTKSAPGLSHLPALVVLFRIAKEPAGGQPGEIEGIEVWEDDDLVAALMRAVQGRPVV